MKVKEVMTPDVKAIWLTESLADAAEMMWQNDCGVLPIIRDGRKVVGIITDRDICMAVRALPQKSYFIHTGLEPGVCLPAQIANRFNGFTA